MKVKFEIKANPKSTTSRTMFTIFMENKTDETVEFLITRFNLQQGNMLDKHAVLSSDVPISDGILQMDKANLKRFIGALQLLAKS